ncbi:hypothetical protein AYO40_04665 [Planctomycetaceae bacterium SCGC AG-212-D15]|nr:hypothetical protein AYO40_04665 [Planctomycetaceae bacterium SCGC AG-212-D15]
MDKALQKKLLALSDEVEATAIPADRKHTIVWCLEKLPSLYADYQSSNESRFGDEITRLLHAVMKELTRGTGGCKEAEKIATGMAGRFQTINERLNLPALILRAPTVPLSGRSPKRG